MRSVKPWSGKNDDTPAPPRVRDRVYEREAGKCHRCKRLIGPQEKWTLEHRIAIENGGKNQEDNLCCTCDWCLPIKNALDAAIKKKITKIRQRHLGIKPKSRWPKRAMGHAGVSNVRDINEE